MMSLMTSHHLQIHCKFEALYHRQPNVKADFHSAVVDCTYFERKRSQKIDRATFCTEWKSAFMVAGLRAGEALYSLIVVLFPIGNNTTIQCLARAQAGNHNIGLPMTLLGKTIVFNIFIVMMKDTFLTTKITELCI
jgi:hypothetical protein